MFEVKTMLKVKNADITCYMLTSLLSLQQRNVKTSKKSVKIVNINNIILI